MISKNIRRTASATITTIICICLLGMCLLAASGCGSQKNSSQQSKSVSTTDKSSKQGQTTSTNQTSSSKTTTKKTSAKKTLKTIAVNKNNVSDVKNPDYKSKYYIVVYTGNQSTVVYGKDQDGAYNKIIQCFSCSTGAGSSPTKTGMYKVRSKYRWRLLVGQVYGQYSSGIGNNYLFHSVPYKAKNAATLDNAEYDKLGSPASHGCIRLCVRDSKWIYDNVPIGTQVRVVNSSGPAGWSFPRRNPDPIYSGWDPSDQWAAQNPYFILPVTTSSTTGTSQTTTSSTSVSTTETSSITSTSSTTEASTISSTEANSISS